MKEFFHSIKFRILILILSLLLGFMVYAAINSGAATIPEAILGTVTKPFVELSNWVSNSISDSIEQRDAGERYKKENEQLKEKLTEIYEKIIDYDKIKIENEQLYEMLELKKENSDLVLSPPTSIIARNVSDPYVGFTINRGSNDGISLYDPVVTSLGLVGRVTKIAPTYANVSTVLSPDVKIGVMTQRKQATGVLENTLEQARNGNIVMTDITKDADIIVGDLVVTSGQGGVFPINQIVGTVKELHDDSSGLFRKAIIEPIQDPDSLLYVFCITDFKGKDISFVE